MLSIHQNKKPEIILNYLNSNPDIEFIDELYHISNIEILEVIKNMHKKKLLWLYHMSQNYHLLYKTFQQRPKISFFISQEKFPTSALFQLIFNTNKWNKVSKYNSKIINFVNPKTLIFKLKQDMLLNIF